MSDGLPDDKLTISRVTELEAQVDRLARILAGIEPEWYDNACEFRCHACGGSATTFGMPAGNHADGCVYLWAVEHVAALEAR